ncbi:MAG: HAMP domain-containing histidine kinase [Chitinophagaceae bacterium]|nr:HAMP domain-containing histidine kinase [Chitinophagaceae bacterium]
MLGTQLNWKFFLWLAAIIIVSSTIIYSNYVAKKIAIEERKNAEAWVEAERTILNSTDTASINLASKISTENKEIPIIETNEKGLPTGNYINLDSTLIQSDSSYLTKKLIEFKRYNPYPIRFIVSEKPLLINSYYYGESELQKAVRWYPYVQLLIIALFVAFAFFNLQTQYNSTQNHLWASMAKETAHQLGTPVSSLKGWLELLKEKKETAFIAGEIEKDIDRLQLVSDRFGKIGSSPKTESIAPVDQVRKVVDYMKGRSSGNVQFDINCNTFENTKLLLSPTLFDWVIENLIKNALDAIEGKGKITIEFYQPNTRWLSIDIHDTGKGMSKQLQQQVFTPGVTTKKRGWGIGLSLSKRVIEQYHKGQLFIKQSEPGVGTIFTINLPVPS